MTDTQADQTFTSVEVPWMKIGTRVDQAVTAAEAIELAGLNWEAERRPAGYVGNDGSWKVHPNRVAIVRGDTDEVLSNRAEAYEVVQYREAFDFVDRINPNFVSAGSLVGGKQAFMVVQAPEHTRLDLLDGEDPHGLYIVMRTSHDASRGIEVALLPLRDKCMNQLHLPSLTRGSHQRMSFRHTRSVHQKLEQASTLFTNLDAYAEEVQETASQLAAIDLELEEARAVLDEVVPKDLKSREARIDRIASLYQNSPLNGYAGNGWGLVNAVSEYHEYHHGGERRNPATRFLQGMENGSTNEAVHRTVAALRRRR
jgi:phage/plasmid-like protein (TIGR03299 family)